MATKKPAKKPSLPKNRTATRKVAEAAPKYTARSGAARAKRARKPKSPGEEMWAAFLKLSDDEQGAFIRKMFSTREWREEIGDSLIVIESRNEPHRPIEEYFAERESRK